MRSAKLNDGVITMRHTWTWQYSTETNMFVWEGVHAINAPSSRCICLVPVSAIFSDKYHMQLTGCICGGIYQWRHAAVMNYGCSSLTTWAWEKRWRNSQRKLLCMAFLRYSCCIDRRCTVCVLGTENWLTHPYMMEALALINWAEMCFPGVLARTPRRLLCFIWLIFH